MLKDNDEEKLEPVCGRRNGRSHEARMCARVSSLTTQHIAVLVVFCIRRLARSRLGPSAGFFVEPCGAKAGLALV